MKVSNEVKVGAVAVISIALFYFGFNYLKGVNLLEKRNQFFAIYNNLSGLSLNNPVQINGYNVGKVNKVELIKDHSGRILVGFVITEPEFNIPKNSIAQIVSLDLLGSKGISLDMGNSIELAQTGDTIMSDIEEDLAAIVDERIAPLETKVNALLGNVDSAIVIVQNILDKEARGQLTASFESIRRTFETFEQTSKELEAMIAEERNNVESILSSVKVTASTLEKNNDQITSIITNLNTISDSLSAANFGETVSSANKALKDLSALLTTVNEGNGTVGQLLYNDTLYYNLEQASLELDKLLEDMRVNPKRYVHFSIFGKSEKPEEKPAKKTR